MTSIIKSFLFKLFIKFLGLYQVGLGLRPKFIRKASRWIYRKIKYDGTICVASNGYRFALDTRDSYFTQSLIVMGHHEPWETRVFMQWLKPRMVMVDIGAHVGWYTVHASNAVGPEGKVFAFEPDPSNFELLKRNIAINHCANTKIIQKAVSDFSGGDALMLDSENRGGHRLMQAAKDAQSVMIDTITLDDYFEGRRVPIHLLKMDIEGAEIKAWKGMQRLIRHNRHILIMTEFYPGRIKELQSTPEAIYNEYRESGFVPHIINEAKRVLSPIELPELMRHCKGGREYTHLFLIQKGASAPPTRF